MRAHQGAVLACGADEHFVRVEARADEAEAIDVALAQARAEVVHLAQTECGHLAEALRPVALAIGKQLRGRTIEWRDEWRREERGARCKMEERVQICNVRDGVQCVEHISARTRVDRCSPSAMKGIVSQVRIHDSQRVRVSVYRSPWRVRRTASLISCSESIASAVRRTSNCAECEALSHEYCWGSRRTTTARSAARRPPHAMAVFGRAEGVPAFIRLFKDVAAGASCPFERVCLFPWSRMALHLELATNKPLHLDEFKNVLVLGAGAAGRCMLMRNSPLLRKLWHVPRIPPRQHLARRHDLVRGIFR